MNNIVLHLHKPYSMAMIKQGKEIIFLGNYWDFHPGCHGTEFRLENGSIVNVNNFSGPRNFAELIARKIGVKVVVKERKRPIPC